MPRKYYYFFPILYFLRFVSASALEAAAVYIFDILPHRLLYVSTNYFSYISHCFAQLLLCTFVSLLYYWVTATGTSPHTIYFIFNSLSIFYRSSWESLSLNGPLKKLPQQCRRGPSPGRLNSPPPIISKSFTDHTHPFRGHLVFSIPITSYYLLIALSLQCHRARNPVIPIYHIISVPFIISTLIEEEVFSWVPHLLRSQFFAATQLLTSCALQQDMNASHPGYYINHMHPIPVINNNK